MSLLFCQYAIVIRNYLPEKNRLILFDREKGLCEVIVPSRGKYTHGALLEFTVKEFRTKYMLAESSVIALPAQWVLEDLVFFHAILELVLYFIPLDSNPTGVFAHLELLRKDIPMQNIVLYKKLFICRLFSLLGICPDDADSFDEKFLYLISAPIDIMLSVQEFLTKYPLDVWMRKCVMSHPQYNMMKIAFIARVESHEPS